MAFSQANQQYLKKVTLDDVPYFLIENVQKIAPFFMTMVSPSNHWMYLWSNGALTAGRKNADFALFPYYTDDKILYNHSNTGCKTIIKVHTEKAIVLWEPFSDPLTSQFEIQRNLYKSAYGHSIIFEEINHSLQLKFSYRWDSSHQFGFVRQSDLINTSNKDIKLEILDGFQNIMAYGVGHELQNAYSNLVNAYKKTELIPATKLGIYALTAIIVDRAEPSEALKANIVWQMGLDNAKILLSDNQIITFKQDKEIFEEFENNGNIACYFAVETTQLQPQQSKKWTIIANVNQSQVQIIDLQKTLSQPQGLLSTIKKDIDNGTQHLIKLIAQADGLQLSSDSLKNTRHFSNVLFNSMRGGIFYNNYLGDKPDFIKYLLNANQKLHKSSLSELEQLPDTFHITLLTSLKSFENQDFARIATEYLPLYFGRRHGDPSRPWNKFSINTQNENNDAVILDYQGNWRDIFQNWEALAFSYPNFTVSFLYKFLNASTFDGYNPYRVTKDGFDWEIIEPDNPWSYIGYWGDHQIIYLLKFLEFIQQTQSETLTQLLDKEIFVYANVPYKIKTFEEIVNNPKDSILFDTELDKTIRKGIAEKGFDAVFLRNNLHEIQHVNFTEKLLATVLSKLSNFIPDAGIWMNTQRPEWNDANNALVGNGASMVTLYYLYRFLHFWEKILQNCSRENFNISVEMLTFFESVNRTFTHFNKYLTTEITSEIRFEIVEKLGVAASEYRQTIYYSGFSGQKKQLPVADIQQFIKRCIDALQITIIHNQRSDKLFHSYNLVQFSSNTINISHLHEMLEGQVAILNAGFLEVHETIELLHQLRLSGLYREDQNSYMLYPNKNLKGFLEKNTFSVDEIKDITFLLNMLQNHDTSIIEQDVNSQLHFNPNFRNVGDLIIALQKTDYIDHQDFIKITALYEKVFNHLAFTGRSGTFYAYEGLGSIYWHMVSKLALAVQENLINAYYKNADKQQITQLTQYYYNLIEGLGLHKSVSQYGAFPTDPYSHTPFGKGVQQPGMTGQVKEDILCRWGELGVRIIDGCVNFEPFFLQKSELNTTPLKFNFVDVNGKPQSLVLPENSIAFTYCQVPVIYCTDQANQGIRINYNNNTSAYCNNRTLSTDISKMIVEKTSQIASIWVTFPVNYFQNLQ